ncbi:PREDICTED: uncharacterized protein LOC108558919 isoform X2 [Nicrophorus vespilloides]|uniref:Uncharacterized protein LOC108558919 isoform X2 n=1 Tax=Nicrophorus vespilloides TaxID=110193 RepID=A0ABM1MA73_NICVS|nr:PREDICTED: uncharacterized protein LOC108558919 isoform X2 [Nicrophorus vespilloides]
MISTTPSKIRVRDTIQNLARKGHRTGRRGIINLKDTLIKVHTPENRLTFGKRCKVVGKK